MKPIYCRQGSKVSMLPELIKLIPEHKIYVEPFAGGLALYFKKEPSDKEIINDLDKDLIKSYRAIKKINIKKNQSKIDEFINYELKKKDFMKLENFYKSSHSDPLDIIIQSLIQSCLTYSSKGKGHIYTNIKYPFKKLENIRDYHDRMSNTIILNTDYKNIIKKYDSPDTFFYLDPPYEKSVSIYTHHSIDYEEMKNILKKIDGYFLLSINDSSYIRDIFKGFKIETISVINQQTKTTRKELLIMNYA